MNKIVNECLVGQGRNEDGQPVWIGYRTNERASFGWPKGIAFQVGLGPASLGAVVDAAKLLGPYYQSKGKLADGKFTFDGFDEEENWFEHRCKEANCEWFVPMVKRMAGGDDVPLEEIKAAYLQHNGQPMPCGEWSKLFR